MSSILSLVDKIQNNTGELGFFSGVQTTVHQLPLTGMSEIN